MNTDYLRQQNKYFQKKYREAVRDNDFFWVAHYAGVFAEIEKRDGFIHIYEPEELAEAEFVIT